MTAQTETQTAAFSGRELRDMFGLFPTGVAIITAVQPGGDYLGATVSSFNSVSLEPPLVLFSMARTSKSYDAWQSVESFAVNILSEEQRALSSQFAKSSAEKWEGFSPIIAEGSGLPLIPNALGSFQCRTWARYDGGDHLIIVGEVFACEKAASGKPLVFSGSRYARLADEA
jgi:flavin reductase (DIM6/NTAB) family NADH-FMN oxidoreductase RutF